MVSQGAVVPRGIARGNGRSPEALMGPLGGWETDASCRERVWV